MDAGACAFYLTSASGLPSWLLGMQLSVGSLCPPFPPHFCFFSPFPDEEEGGPVDEGTLPLAVPWPRGDELPPTPPPVLAFL